MEISKDSLHESWASASESLDMDGGEQSVYPLLHWRLRRMRLPSQKTASVPIAGNRCCVGCSFAPLIVFRKDRNNGVLTAFAVALGALRT
jgi:hypothetical protein